MNYTGGDFKINGKDAFTEYGLIFMPGVNSELLKMPKKKPVYTYSWADEDGDQVDLDAPNQFESISYKLQFVHYGANQDDFYAKYNALRAFIIDTKGYFNLDALKMNQRFRVAYVDMPTFTNLTLIHKEYYVYCKSTMELINYYPTLVEVPE